MIPPDKIVVEHIEREQVIEMTCTYDVSNKTLPQVDAILDTMANVFRRMFPDAEVTLETLTPDFVLDEEEGGGD